jgi:ADP-heptose:LPS heptosyltransferase
MPRAGVLTREARGRRTVGFALDSERYPWYTDIYPNNPGEPRLERNLRLIANLGLPQPVKPEFKVKLPRHTGKNVDELLRSHGIDPAAGPIVVHPGSGNSVRNWPVGRFAELADRLSVHTARPVVLLGGANLTYDGSDEIQLTGRVREAMQGPAADLGGMLDTAGLIYLLECCSLFVGNNSGPAHLAATVAGTPSLLVWAPRNEKIWRPLGKEVVLVTAHPDCDDSCRLNQCERIAECIGMITVDEVFNAYLETIGSLGQLAAAGGGR